MKRIISTIVSATLVLSLGLPTAHAAGEVSIKEQYLFAGATHPYYTEECYYSSPVVTDLDGDGKLEAINAAYSLVVMDAATGEEKWRINAGKDRSSAYDVNGNVAGGQVFTDFEVLDVDADGKKEIVIGYGNGQVSVLDAQGYYKSGWPQKPTSAGIRSLAVADLDLDGKQEIVVGAGVASPESVWVYRCDGSLVPGWPQLSRNHNADSVDYHSTTNPNSPDYFKAYAYGVFADSIAIGDLTGDGRPEIIVPNDTAYVGAYQMDGSLVSTGALYGNRPWGKIAIYEDYDQEIACENEGWGWGITGNETRKELYRAELGHSAAAYTDVDGDGVSEVVVAALIIDRTGHTNTNVVSFSDTKYMTPFIFNQDRSRYVNAAKGFDWSSAPRDLGGPLKPNDSVSMTGGVLPEPVCADLDGDGNQEILMNAYNGKLHCFSLDGKEHGSWPFVLPKSSGSVYEFAAPPACVDINGDGKKEVIVASWTDNASSTNPGVDGALYVLSSDGKVLASRDLHTGYASYEGVVFHSNGVKGAPVVQDIDGDGKFEVLLNTTYYALCAYELDVAGAPAVPEPAPAVAYARSSSILVDGTPVTFNMYALKDANGYETNYVKARDVAAVINGTGSQFNVTWDGAVNFQPFTPYQANGTEMSTPFSGDRTYEDNTAVTKVRGEVCKMESIVLKDEQGNGYTYYKLRDLANHLGFIVDWLPETGIYLNTEGDALGWEG